LTNIEASLTYESKLLIVERLPALHLRLGRLSSANDPISTGPFLRYVVMSTPVLDTFDSTSSSPDAATSSPKRRFPFPTTTG